MSAVDFSMLHRIWLAVAVAVMFVGNTIFVNGITRLDFFDFCTQYLEGDVLSTSTVLYLEAFFAKVTDAYAAHHGWIRHALNVQRWYEKYGKSDRDQPLEPGSVGPQL